MIDLNCIAGSLTTLKLDRLTRVRIVEGSGQNDAVPRTVLERVDHEITGENIITRIAPVSVRIPPPATKQVAVVSSLRRTSLDRHFRQKLQGSGRFLPEVLGILCG